MSNEKKEKNQVFDIEEFTKNYDNEEGEYFAGLGFNKNDASSSNTKKNPLLLKRASSHVIHVKTNKLNMFSNNMTFNFLQIISIILTNAIPSAFALFFIFIGETMNIIIISTYKDGSMLNALGIGTLYINSTGYLMGIGLLGGLDTLCSHSFGAGQFKLVGIYTNISRVVAICFYILICLPLAFFSKSILLSIGQNEVTSQYSSVYVKSMLPAIFFALQFYSSQRYLQSVNILMPGMIITLVTSVLHLFWSWFFIIYVDFEIYGAGLSLSITQFLNLLCISLYIYFYNPNPDTHLEFTCSGISLKRILDFLKLGVPAAILFAANWLGVEVLTLLSSYLNYESLVANVCLLNLTTLIFMIPMGISYALTLLIGQAIGASNVKTARYLSVMGVLIGLMFIGVTNFFIYNFRESIPYLYTDNPLIAAKIIDLIEIYLYFGLIDTLQIILNGIIKGLGKQKMTSIIVLIVLYPVNIPMAYMFGFVINYGLIGLWYSQLTAIILLAISYMIILLCLDWDDISNRSVINMQLIADQIEKYEKK